jgi:four helix bundle protein
MSSGIKTGQATQVAEGSSRPDIRSRSFAYALRAIKLYQYLQGRKNGVGWILGNQYLRSACSVGANVEEAQAGESRADFIHKLGIAQKEARESLYWLRLLSESAIVTKRQLEPLRQETKEIIAIITSILVKCKGRRGGQLS